MRALVELAGISYTKHRVKKNPELLQMGYYFSIVEWWQYAFKSVRLVFIHQK